MNEIKTKKQKQWIKSKDFSALFSLNQRCIVVDCLLIKHHENKNKKHHKSHRRENNDYLVSQMS